MNKERLEDVAVVLETEVTDAEFDMEHWLEINECGTTGCALGYYILRRKLHLQEGQESLAYWSFDKKNLYPWRFRIARHFGITEGKYDRLFIDGAANKGTEYPVVTRQEMIERIRNFIKEKEAQPNEV